MSGEEKPVKIALFRKPGEVAGARRAMSELIKWHELRHGQPLLHDRRRPVGVHQCRARQPVGPLRPGDEPARARALKAAIQEAGNASTAIGLVSQNASPDPNQFAGVWALERAPTARSRR